ncbi:MULTISPECIES: non-hydrolyzing UDP-N-acetylglucosamine 2-epimerase [unclassified Acinetobacter]|uniref:non-hydrolyzing UDP-N-acetylglucosamine 2-epimerase n=1 Tax=unclassified Acinetobacter TaxID=196816 RepID=UPI0015D4137B|nr:MULTISPECIES: UDP-N-acetylglucosamine 2-epimerase (non-hydrolyzing) [unclassified Acinetobacter]
MFNILLVFGTRPEAIKMAPLVHQLKSIPLFSTKVCVTAQHREMLDSVLEIFDIQPDFDLNLMKKGQGLTDITTQMIQQLDQVYRSFLPDLVLVHGDTSTTFSASLAAFYNKIKIGHIEAGLRTGNIYSPWPEEANRKLTGILSNFHFAPTQEAKENLLKEGYSEKQIFVTGNTVIDALYIAKNKIENSMTLDKKFQEQFHFLNRNKKIIIITGHRRENLDGGLENICAAVKQLSDLYPDIQFVYPVHPNPKVQETVSQILSQQHNIFLIAPLDYLPFVWLMKHSYLILTDSGGIQEEAPSLGIPVLVTRENTERPEALEAGTIQLVGTDKKKIIDTVSLLIQDTNHYKKMSQAVNPYGDGYASEKVVKIIQNFFYDF